MSEGSTQPGMMLTLAVLPAGLFGALQAMDLTMLEKPVTCEPT
jgi:hypothetical protein